ncbi:P-loop containing nucleoside triphosphate hydrolase protein [Panaeolus papilionaceus]|nr:P-loop containing nucleoside triphosphate hydrolase protein [Panaeolus papilionaceus]
MSHYGRRRIHVPSEPSSSTLLHRKMSFFHQANRRGTASSQDEVVSPTSVATADEDWQSAIETLFDEEGPIPELRPEDTIIALMGLTGSGKSTFINTITGQENLAKVGHSLLSCTQEINTYTYLDPRDGRRIVFVDTPGFDDTNLADLIILDMVTQWLNKTYSAKCKLSGLLFFHRISDNRMGQTAIHHLDVFRNLCGNSSLSNVILVTSMWDELRGDTGEEREKQLKTVYWSNLISNGARTARHDRSLGSCYNILDLIRSSRKERPTLLIQHEMVDKGLPFDSTSVAATLKKRLQELVKALASLIRSLENNPDSARKAQEEQKKALFIQQLRHLSRRSHAKPRAWTFPFVSFKKSAPRKSSIGTDDDYDIISPTELLPPSPLQFSPISPGSTTSSSSKLSSASFDLYFGVYTSLDESIKVLNKMADLINLGDSTLEAELVKAVLVTLNVAKALKKIINVDRDIISLLGRVAFFMRAVWDCQDSIDGPMKSVLGELLANLEHLEKVATKASHRPRLLRFSVPQDIRPIITTCHEYITLGCKTMEIENIVTQDTNIARLEGLLVQHIDNRFDQMETKIDQMSHRTPCAACRPPE